MRLSPASDGTWIPTVGAAVAAPIRLGYFCQDEEWPLARLGFFLNPREMTAVR